MNKAESAHWTFFIPKKIEGQCKSCKFAVINIKSTRPSIPIARVCGTNPIDEYIKYYRDGSGAWVKINAYCRKNPRHVAVYLDNFCGGYVLGNPEIYYISEAPGRGGRIKYDYKITSLKVDGTHPMTCPLGQKEE